MYYEYNNNQETTANYNKMLLEVYGVGGGK